MSVETIASQGQSQEHAELLGALDRLFTIGTYYPAGHTLVIEVAERFACELRRSIAGAATLGIDVGRSNLFIGGQSVDPAVRGAARLHDLLDRLGVARLELDEHATPEELHRFVTAMQRLKLEADTAQGFCQFDLGDFGGAIRVVQREFGQRLGGAGMAFRSDQVKAAVDSVLQALERDDLDEGTRAACERLVEKLFTRVAERMELETPPLCENRPAFGRSLEDVFALGTHAIRHALMKTLPDATAPDDLMRVFENAERALALADDDDTVELMLDVFRQATQEARGSRRPAQSVRHTRESETCEWSMADLRRRIAEAASAGQRADVLAPGDRCEGIATLLQVAAATPPPAVAAEAVRLLRESLAPPLQTAERDLLVTALRDVIAGAPLELTDALLGAVGETLRPDRQFPLGALLRDIAHGLSSDVLAATWPHVVNQILMGLEDEKPPTVEVLHRIAAAPEAEQMRRWLPRLEGLAAIRDGHLSPRWLHAPPAELLPLCAQLLTSSQGLTIGTALWEGGLGRPPPWLRGRALRLLGDYQPRHRPLLARLLGDAPRGAPTAATRTIASRLLSEALAALPPARRRSAEAVDAIAALGQLGEASVVPLLQTIQRQRRFLVMPAWPSSCRQAAGDALRLLRSSTPPATAVDAAPERGDTP